MLFTSLEFVFFLPLVVCAYYLLPQRARWGLLLAASYYFYASWRVDFLVLIVASTLVDYAAGLAMGGDTERPGRKKWLWASLGVNLGLLFTFKYFAFFTDSLAWGLGGLGIQFDSPAFDLILPVGISFYTFQTLSYTIDVYRGQKEPERHLGIFALYVSFFPQLVAGPIERSTSLMPQMYERHGFDWVRIRLGLTQVLLGFFKKVVIADRLALYVDEVYANSGDYAGAPMWIATYFFAIQVYCDFAGYSDIAIGSARCMGYKLVTNFKRPYLADSFKSFWERWHISLTMWFRDYVYFALGGSRKGRLRTYFNILALFTLCGLWHGARWNCVLWGTANGVYLVMGQLTRDAQDRWARLVGLHKVPLVRKVLAILFTFTLFVVSLMIWRSETIPNAITNIGLAFSSGANSLSVTAPMAGYELSLAVIALALLLALEIAQERKDSELLEEFNAKPRWIRWPVYYAGLYSVLIFGVFDLREFVYFQF